jgi:hypothetical protein
MWLAVDESHAPWHGRAGVRPVVGLTAGTAVNRSARLSAWINTITLTDDARLVAHQESASLRLSLRSPNGRPMAGAAFPGALV